jgi:hypothetical protein
LVAAAVDILVIDDDCVDREGGGTMVILAILTISHARGAAMASTETSG